jgi:2-polyprenyl-3-methyl-5-hydroxy-6-metoxy-1,4-benzoquinol methylase
MSYTCRFCNNKLQHTFVDLGMSPLANSYLKHEQLQQMEAFYSLHTYLCEKCFLVQLPEMQSPKHIFSDYAYFSSYSESLLQHARDYTDLMIRRFGFDSKNCIIEVASNDGYLLQYFKEKGIPVLGIEPASNVAESAVGAGIPTIVKFFGTETAKELVAEGNQADLLIGNNVLAHVPDLNDFVEGIHTLLKEQGIVTMEFPHIMRMMADNLFDTIYHEHYSYFSLITVREVFAAHGLKIFDVDEISTHGGSLRIYACHTNDSSKPVEQRIQDLLRKEEDVGFNTLQPYLTFSEKVRETKRNILDFMIKEKRQGKIIAAYGAPAKGCTLLNYCGIRSDFIEYTVDRSPHKQGHYLPGIHIPIYDPDKIRETKPDYLVILAWNLKDEIMKQMSHIQEWGGKFVVLMPEVKIF